MTPAQEFAHAQRLAPQEAIAYMKGRELVGETYDWRDLWHQEHGRAFTISRLARADLLEALQQSLAKSVAGDMTRRDWIKDAEKLLKNAGWWGTKEVTDPRTGELLKTRFDHPRLQLIYDTNVRQAQAAGQWQRLLRNQGSTPYARYVTMHDDRVRDAHRRWHNVTLPLDDPWWDTHRPPNGWRCRCRIVGVTQREYDAGETLDRPGAEDDINAPIVRTPLRKEPPQDATIAWRNPVTGEVQRIPAGIDPGFDYNAGASGRSKAFEELVQGKLVRMDPRLAQAAKADGLQPPKIAKEVPGQSTWKTLGLEDLRGMQPSMAAPELLEKADSIDGAVEVLRGALGLEVNGTRTVQTPAGPVVIFDDRLLHVVEKRLDARERYGRFVLPTLESPDEVWKTAYDDDTVRRRYIKLFSDSKYDVLVIVREGADGSVLWNLIQRDRKGMNALRVGHLTYQGAK
ncbi:MAG: minor capsid protein [Comamonadaceae bacterium]|nr:minor capsid protein [Comamonadaceae bacterium]